MTTLRVNAEMNVDGKQASVELKKLVGNVADTKIALAAAKAEAAKLSAEMKGLNRSTAEGAARAAELKQQLRAATVAETEAASAAAAAARQYDNLNRSQGRVATSAGQVRAATANLGQQIGDIGQGLALGISPATVFAQQAGQVGFALSGMGGALGRVGSFLSGPFGAALTVGVIGLGVLAKSSRDTAQAARVAEDGTVSFATEAKVAFDILGSAAEKSLKPLGQLFGRAVDELKDRLPSLNTAITETLQAIDRLNNFGADVFGTARTDNAGDFQRERAKRVAMLAAEDRERALNNGRFGTAFVDNIAKKTKEATKAQQDGNAALREAEERAKAYARAMREAQDAAIALGENVLKSFGDRRSRSANDFEQADRAADREASGIERIVREAEERFPKVGDRLGQKAADGFRDGALADAAAIGQAIGGSAGRVFTSISALGFGTQGKNGTQDFTGVGGKVEKLITGIGGVFGTDGGRKFAGLVGKAAGGAATGSVVSGIGDALGIKNSKAGASIGGAIGGVAQSLGLPFGEIIGSVLGGLLPGLFGSKPKGSTTVSASGGKISQSSTGNSAIQKATGTIGNSITDAIQSIADQLGASIGDFSVSIGKEGDRFRVDTSGQGRTRKNNSTVLGFGEDEGAALAAAIADALKDGAIKSSPRVQAALTAYGDNVNKAVAEALKVKGLEDLLADRDNPFTSTFRQLEQQLKQRVDVAAKYGFDLVQIEKVNGEDRAKALKETLEAGTSSVRQLLNDLKFGSRATGSPVERLAGLAAERDRLSGLVRGGDTSQLDAVASIIQQIDDLQKETFGATGGFASGRADSVSLLNDLVRQTEERIKAAADAARTAPNPQLTEMNASLDDQYALQSEMKGLQTEMRALLTSIDRSLASGGGFGLAAQFAR